MVKSEESFFKILKHQRAYLYLIFIIAVVDPQSQGKLNNYIGRTIYSLSFAL